VRIVVTGGTGFIGKAITRELRRRGHDVVTASRHGEVSVDVNDSDSLVRAFDGADAVVNAVQFTNYPVEDRRRGLTFDAVDRAGTERQVRAAADAGVSRLLYVSGIGADPDGPRHWYRAKGEAESAIRAQTDDHFILRPSWVYGPEDASLNRFVPIARRVSLLPVVGDGTQQLEPVFVGDVAWAFGEAVDQGTKGTFEIGGPERLSMDEVERTLAEVLGRHARLVHIPAGLVRTVGRLAGALPRPRLSSDAVEFLVGDALADTAPLVGALPALPRTRLVDGLRGYLPNGGAVTRLAGRRRIG
jgi:NADH dehydrogenase